MSRLKADTACSSTLPFLSSSSLLARRSSSGSSCGADARLRRRRTDVDGTAHIEVPPTPHADEDTAWKLAAADVGTNVAMLAIGIAVLWRWGTGLVTKMFASQAEERAAADARHETFLAAQVEERRATEGRFVKIAEAHGKSTEDLAVGLHRVEMAVVRSDEHNTAAINGLRQTMDRHESRLDRVDLRLDAQGERITVLEHGGPSARHPT